MDYLYLIIGFVILLSSGDLLVKGGVALSSHFKISTLVVGVTVISFGTSAPELFVSLGAALSGSPDIAIGNVVGSNVSNIALVLGFTALLLPLPVKSNSLKFDWPVMMGASLLFFAFAQNNLIETWEGISFLILLIAYMIFTVIKSRGNKEEVFKKPEHSILKAVGLIVLSSIGLYFGADLLVGAAKNIALGYGVSERVIGLTLVAFGTSVPELATSAIAALKKEMDISVGNIIGSNIFNIFGVLGITSVVKNIFVSNDALNFDMIWMLAISFLLFLLVLPLKKAKLHRWKGLILILVYSAYVFFIFNK
ncbi:sodium:calcium antiporter [Ancylomarina euxinus]|uniref:Sodium:calcium antiporter n=1 Tax=Ancylomarina euxinus TaxID=2283627 RepID=A0A425XYC5_9BACT|nr:calcium/sodium antiporter [Ancylomarina euxinus]MCZ4695807.1 calcium/sodium antiporter [Ancylomarina euxinus]MUP16130.1 calcium/sodium antiporter [Ancylomarina euxinus]RRG19850.1 sodium:calcium antiporter [Ancylomarina euxinus]